jgi:hypothetical protein
MLRVWSLVMFVAAIVGVFVEIPIVSDYAFWVMVAATIIYLSNVTALGPYSWVIMVAIVMLLAAIVGVFRYIPMVSEYAFWVVAAAYLLLVGSTK